MTIEVGGLPANPAQIADIKTGLGLEQVNNTPDLSKPLSGAAAAADVALQNQLNNLANSQSVNLKTIQPGPAGELLSLDSAGPFTDSVSNITYPTARAALAAAFALARSGSGNSSGPVISAKPSMTFAGGSADVNESPTVTAGTYSSGTVTGRTYQYEVNGVLDTTRGTNGVWSLSGSTGQPVPQAAGQAPRQLVLKEYAAWTGGAAVVNPSNAVTVNTPGIPVKVTDPSIAPLSVTEVDTLTPTRGTYEVSGQPIANSLLTFDDKWTADWTLTGSLSGGATSATLSGNWLFTTGAYSVLFSNGDVKSVNFTQNSAAITWTGGLSGSATSAIVVTVSTSVFALALNSNNVAHAMQWSELPTGPGGPAASRAFSNKVTPTSSSGTVEPGRLYLSSIPSTGAKSWADIAAMRTAYPPDTFVSGVVSRNAQALVAGIPTSGGTLFGTSVTVAQIEAALATGNVFLSGGTYHPSRKIVFPNGNFGVYGVAGQVVIFDLSSGWSGDGHPFVTWPGGGNTVANIKIYRSPRMGFWVQGNGFFFHKMSFEECGFSGEGWPTILGGQFNTVGVSFEILRAIGGGNADGYDIGQGGGNVELIDGHFRNCDDDGPDAWNAVARCYLHYCTFNGMGFNTAPGAVSGDGNGAKLGPMSGNCSGHVFNQCSANGNKGVGFVPNAAPIAGRLHVLRLCTAGNNGQGNFNYGHATPNLGTNPDYIVLTS